MYEIEYAARRGFPCGAAFKRLEKEGGQIRASRESAGHGLQAGTAPLSRRSLSPLPVTGEQAAGVNDSSPGRAGSVTSRPIGTRAMLFRMESGWYRGESRP